MRLRDRPRAMIVALQPTAPALPAAWARELVETALALVAVPRLLWVALVLLTVLRIVSAVLWASGKGQPETRRHAFFRVPLEALRIFFVLFGFTITGNAVPILGWVVVVSWSTACAYTARKILNNATSAESELRGVFGQIAEEIGRRNLNAMRPNAAAGTVPTPEPGTTPAPTS